MRVVSTLTQVKAMILSVDLNDMQVPTPFGRFSEHNLSTFYTILILYLIVFMLERGRKEGDKRKDRRKNKERYIDR